MQKEIESNSLKLFINSLSENLFFSNVINEKNKIIITSNKYTDFDRIAKCPERLAGDTILEDAPEYEEEDKKRTRKSHIEWFAEIMETRCPTEEEMRRALKCLEPYNGFISRKNADGTFSSFELQSKLSRRYYKRVRFQIVDAIKKAEEQGGELFALTVTYAYNLLDLNRRQAWGMYWGHCQKVTQYLKRKLDIDSVTVLESTAKGYPHAHIVLSVPKENATGIRAKRGRKVIKSGKLYEMIKKRLFSPIFRLERIEGENTRWYLSKYMSKSAKEDILSLASKKEPWTKEERKTVMCILATIACGIRQYSIARSLKADKTEEERKIEEAQKKVNEMYSSYAKTKLYQDIFIQKTAPKHSEKRKEGCARLRTYLISLCNKSTCGRMEDISIISRRRMIEIIKQNPNIKIETPDDFAKFVYENGTKNACKGCYLQDIVRFVLYKEKNAVSVFFEDIDMSDDEAYIDAFVHAINTMQDRMHYCNEQYWSLSKKLLSGEYTIEPIN